MKPSPIQLLQVFLQHVSVELDPQHLPPEMPNPLVSAFSFDGVSIQTEFGLGEGDAHDERGRIYFLSLKVVVDNAPNPGAPAQQFSPYRIDVAVEGMVLVPRGAEKLAPPEDLVLVNGAVMLWSVVREQVLALTSRMRAGPVMLPTVHFHDLKGGGSQAEVIAAPAPSAAPRKRSNAPARRAPDAKRG